MHKLLSCLFDNELGSYATFRANLDSLVRKDFVQVFLSGRLWLAISTTSLRGGPRILLRIFLCLTRVDLFICDSFILGENLGGMQWFLRGLIIGTSKVFSDCTDLNLSAQEDAVLIQHQFEFGHACGSHR